MPKTSLKTVLCSALLGVLGAQVALAGGMGGGGPTTPISFSGVTNVSFGVINVTVGTGNIDIGTNGTIIYGAGYSGSGVGTPGQFIVGGDVNFDVDISCSATATLANSAGSTMPISLIEIRNRTGAAFGAGSTCAGIGNTILTSRIRNQIDRNTFFIGMRINGTGGVPAGAGYFSTSNAGGTPMTIDVVYQ